MVIFNPEYLKKHPEVMPGLRAEVGEGFKNFVQELAEHLAGGPSSGLIQLTRWRKHWDTSNARLRKELLAHTDVWVYVGSERALRVKLRDIPAGRWGELPDGGVLIRLPVALRVGLVTNPPCTLDPRPLVSIEIHCERVEKGPIHAA
jgi:hypothetical protein